MAVSFVSANAAYQTAARMGEASGAAQAAGEAASAQPQGFGTILKDTMDTMRAGETAAAQGATGRGDIVQIVNAVTQAELTLETVVAVRDKVISAYQDIMRMPI